MRWQMDQDHSDSLLVRTTYCTFMQFTGSEPYSQMILCSSYHKSLNCTRTPFDTTGNGRIDKSSHATLGYGLIPSTINTSIQFTNVSKVKGLPI
ncbi:hypothetical protein TNIN_136721 [Trichonephila inaurata madagascariensis]|uniref:Uncharacterized protein n=1 Tax=Trichonephila inaurata madagascariensis TaxID=2747483 RepID=A0A8X6IB18_9ARAC|nr:hypothetical protein TNIN_136721 [Trichonephila inaurata madagascariensis]